MKVKAMKNKSDCKTGKKFQNGAVYIRRTKQYLRIRKVINSSVLLPAIHISGHYVVLETNLRGLLKN